MPKASQHVWFTYLFVTRTLSKSSIKQKPKSERDREGARKKENAKKEGTNRTSERPHFKSFIT